MSHLTLSVTVSDYLAGLNVWASLSGPAAWRMLARLYADEWAGLGHDVIARMMERRQGMLMMLLLLICELNARLN